MRKKHVLYLGLSDFIRVLCFNPKKHVLRSIHEWWTVVYSPVWAGHLSRVLALMFDSFHQFVLVGISLSLSPTLSLFLSTQ